MEDLQSTQLTLRLGRPWERVKGGCARLLTVWLWREGSGAARGGAQEQSWERRRRAG